MFENIRMAFVGLRSNKLRSILTMLGITIGVAAVIILVSIGQAVDHYIQNEFASLGTNLVIVFGREDSNGVFHRATLDDADALSNVYNVPDALIVMPQRVLTLPVKFEGTEISVRIFGVTPDYLAIRNRSVIAGRFFEPADMDGLGRIAIIGQDTLEHLFPAEVYPIGQSIRIGDITFRVEGVLNRVGASGFGGQSDDDLIIVPITTLLTRLSGERILSGDRPLSSILLQARTSDSVDSLTQQVRDVLRDEHRISFRDEDDFQIFTQTDLLSSLGSITALLTVFLGLIAGISLLVGGIGIMNIMLVTVTERTREIGLRKAVGAQRWDILMQFLTEATVLALFGGGIGVLFAFAGTLLVATLVPDLPAAVQPSSVLLATVISMMIGVFFGSYPANRAAKLNPIDALRYE